jgi:hypothetical protein
MLTSTNVKIVSFKPTLKHQLQNKKCIIETRSSVRTAFSLNMLSRGQRSTAVDSSDHSATDADWEVYLKTTLFVRWSHTPRTYLTIIFLLLDLGSHSGNYEEYSFLMWRLIVRYKFADVLVKPLPPSSGSKEESIKQAANRILVLTLKMDELPNYTALHSRR